MLLTSCVLLSAFVLFISYAPCDVSAESYVSNGAIYNLVEGEPNTATVTGCEDTIADLIIDSKITKDGVDYIVESINPNAFQNKTSLKTVKIAFIKEGEIPTNAFSGCINLESVELAEGFTAIQSSAFKDCTNLKKVVLPQTLTTIGVKAFSQSGVEEIDLKNVETIGSRAFESCKNLKSVDLTSVKALAGTFDGCSSLKSCKLGSNLTSMEGNVFCNTAIKAIDIPASCDLPTNPSHFTILWYNASFEAINIAEGHKQYYSKDGIVYQNETGKLFYCPENKTGSLHLDGDVANDGLKTNKLTEITFSDKDMRIEGAFLKGNPVIKEITIPSNVTFSTSDYILSNCSALEYVKIMPGITKLSMYFFNECNNLKIVDIPDTVVEINAFYMCPKLDLCIPDSVKIISEGSFLVKTISIPDGITKVIEEGLNVRLDSQKLTADLVRGKSFSVNNNTLSEVSTVKYNVDGKLWYAAAISDTDFTPVTTLVNGYDLKWFTDSEFKNPYVPGKVTETLQLYAQKTPIQYTATFVDENGNKISEVKFTVEDKELKEPAVPAKVGYEGKWSYTIKAQDLTISPKYTPIKYKISFMDENNEVSKEIEYTIETKNIEMPEGVPKASDDKYTYAFKYWANSGVEFVFNAPMTGDFTLKPYYLATAKAVKVDDSDSVVDAKDLEEVSVDITEEIKDAGLKVDLKDNASLRFKDVTNIVDKTLISSVKKIENASGVEGNAYSLSITVDGDRYTGEMEITLPYSPTDGKVPVVYWINGTEKVAMKIISSDDKSVTFVTDHNSTYVVAEEEPAEESSNTALYITVAAVVIVLIAAAVLVARRH